MTKDLNVLVLMPLQQEDRNALEAAAPDVRFTFSSRDFLTEEAAQADIVFSNPPPARIGEFKKLKWVQLISAGADPYADGKILPESCLLTNTTGAHAAAISEYLLGAVFTNLLNFHRLRDNQRSGLWQHEGMAVSLRDSTVMIVGLGKIGTEFARCVKAIGAKRVIGIRRTVRDKPEFVDELYATKDIDAYIGEADIVVSMLPGTSETENIFDAERISRLKEGCVFVNGGRGSAVDLDALVAALDQGRLRGAAIDVTSPEPLPSGHPAWQCRNLLITPHIASGFLVSQNPTGSKCITLRHVLGIFSDNLARYQKGEPLVNLVAHN